MELEESSGSFETQFMVPPYMKDGDTLTPFQFSVFSWGVRFYFFGRYNEQKDMVEFVVAGPSGYKYKISLADGNSPYGWKVKKHGVTRSASFSFGLTDRVLGFFVDKFLVMAGKDSSRDYLRDIAMSDAFAMEEVIGVPMAIMRISHRSGVMDAREKCIGPWSFYGPSLPEAFCRCRLKVLVYNWWGDSGGESKSQKEGSAAPGSAPSEGQGDAGTGQSEKPQSTAANVEGSQQSTEPVPVYGEQQQR